jgi:predicted CXXCH cytochrome family protein
MDNSNNATQHTRPARPWSSVERQDRETATASHILRAVRFVLALRLAIAVAACAAASFALAGGGHQSLGCVGCHSMHAARGDHLAAVAPNVKMPEARTGKPHGAITAACLGCHADVADGGKGILPVSEHMRHPFSLERPNPRVAKVPEELLRGGRFECLSCHDPHPSNPNYRYLRIAARSAPTMSQLCSLCHSRKADPNYAPPKLFDSMDERAERPAPASR